MKQVILSNENHNKFCIDKSLHSLISHFTGWLSPGALILAYSDWLIHLSSSPEKFMNTSKNYVQNFSQFMAYILESCSSSSCRPCIKACSFDKRFQSTLWNQIPFNFYSQSFLLYERWWDNITTDVQGVSKHHGKLVNFTFRQLLDVFSPSNIPWMNPDVLEITYEQFGTNFARGFGNWLEDVKRYTNKQLPVGTEQFQVGKDVAITPGKVIYQNHLIELIQYTPTTKTVYPEPILIVPAWIMKYYILDLSPRNSIAKYLVDNGHTVFMISWRNPGSKDRNLGMDDYVNLGVMDALDAINHIIPKQRIHSVGYCIGGTLLMIAAAWMAKNKDDRLKSITLFATQVDFKDAGELLLFIDESQVTYLEDIMWENGYLDGSQMAGAFSMLRSIELIWSNIILDYMCGERRKMSDLMAWDNDTTRLPYRMHSEYLRKLFLENSLAEGHYEMNGVTLSLLDISAPIFSVSASRDHVAPWESVYKINLFTEIDITFVLTSGGHNSGVVNEPNQSGHDYKIMINKKGDKYISPDKWEKEAQQVKGSWWPAWHKWLAAHSTKKSSPPELGNAKLGYKILRDAPGIYVFQK